MVDPLGQEPLGRHVLDRADRRPGRGHSGAVDRAGDPEVDEVDEVGRTAATGAQHVGRLDVAVHQPVGVRGVQRGGDLLYDVDGCLRVERPTAQDGAQVGTLHQTHVDEELAVDLAVAVDRDHMRLA